MESFCGLKNNRYKGECEAEKAPIIRKEFREIDNKSERIDEINHEMHKDESYDENHENFMSHPFLDESQISEESVDYSESYSTQSYNSDAPYYHQSLTPIDILQTRDLHFNCELISLESDLLQFQDTLLSIEVPLDLKDDFSNADLIKKSHTGSILSINYTNLISDIFLILLDKKCECLSVDSQYPNLAKNVLFINKKYHDNPHYFRKQLNLALKNKKYQEGHKSQCRIEKDKDPSSDINFLLLLELDSAMNLQDEYGDTLF